VRRSAYVLRRPVDNVYLVRDRDRRRRRELLTILVAAAPVGFCLLVYIWTHLQVLEAGYRIDLLGHQLHEMAQHERHLRLEAAGLFNPGLLEERAQRELKMVPPAPENVFALERAP
jgi:hypothetical protein